MSNASAVPPGTVPPPKKSNAVKWLIGCGCGCLLLIALAVAAAIFVPGLAVYFGSKAVNESVREMERKEREKRLEIEMKAQDDKN